MYLCHTNKSDIAQHKTAEGFITMKDTINQIRKQDVTVKTIFDANQVLTYDVAKQLIGKTIATTYCGYNPSTVGFVKITGFISEWDYAATDHDVPNYSSRQEYWKSCMTEKQIAEAKNTILLLGENGKRGPHHISIYLDDHFFSEPTATCSDADREVYYVVIDDEN